MSGVSGLWVDILVSRYGLSKVSSLDRGRSLGSNLVSTWWKGVSLIGSKKEDPPNWFENGLVRKIGSGLSTSFWHDFWVDNSPLSSRFYRLFTISHRKSGLVGEMGRWDEGKVLWDLGWSRSFFIYEEPMVEEFFLLLQGFQFSEERDS